MKKLITLLILFVGMVSSVSATDYKIYIKSNSNTNYVHVWGVTSGGTEWPGVQLSTLPTETILDETFYVKSLSTETSFNFLCHVKDGASTSDWTGITRDIYVDYNSGTDMSDVTLAYNVALPGSHNGWDSYESIFDRSGENYVYALNAPSSEFKIYAFGAWKGFSNVNLSPADWFTTGDGDNIKLKDNGYQKYTFTAKENESKWDLTASVSAEDAYRFTIAGSSAILKAQRIYPVGKA